MNENTYLNIGFGIIWIVIAILAFQYFYTPPFEDNFSRPLFKYDFSDCVKNQAREAIKTVEESKDNELINSEEIKIFQSLANNDLDPEDSIALCHFLGIDIPEMQKYWTANQVAKKVYGVDAYSHDFIKQAESIFDQVSDYLESEWAFQFSTTVHIILASDTKRLGALIPNDITNEETQTLLDTFCDSHEVRGLAFGPVLVICFTGDKDTDNYYLESKIAHTLFYSVVTELSGLGPKDASYEERVIKYGPSWMLQGCAGVFAGLYMASQVKDGEAKFQSEFEKLKSSINHLEYDEYISFYFDKNKNYKDLVFDSELFCYALIQDHGKKAIMDFYSNIRHEPAGWETLFKSTFKTTPNDFISSFSQQHID